MASEKVLKGKLQIIVDDLSELDESDSHSIKAEMITSAGFTSYDEETEVIQYVDGMYNATFAYYDNEEIPT